MDSKKYTLIGGVILASLFIFVILLIGLGGSGLLTKKMEYKVYFSQSVKGLGIGAPVTFRGVRIGEVTNICLAQIYDSSTADDVSYPVEVTFVIESEQLELENESVDEDDTDESGTDDGKSLSYYDKKFRKTEIIENWVNEMVEKHGMVARLQTVSLLTGQLTISLDTTENTTLSKSAKLNLLRHILPTGSSAVDKLRQALQKNNVMDLTQKLVEIVADFVNSGKAQQTLSNIHNLTQRSEAVLKEMEIAIKTLNGEGEGQQASLKDIMARAQATMDEINGLVKQVKEEAASVTARLETSLDTVPRVEGKVEESLNNIDDLTADLRKLLEEGGKLQQILGDTQSSVAIVNGMLKEDSPERLKVEQAFNELDRTLRSVRDLTEMLINKPEVLIRGK